MQIATEVYYYRTNLCLFVDTFNFMLHIRKVFGKELFRFTVSILYLFSNLCFPFKTLLESVDYFIIKK